MTCWANNIRGTIQKKIHAGKILQDKKPAKPQSVHIAAFQQAMHVFFFFFFSALQKALLWKALFLKHEEHIMGVMPPSQAAQIILVSSHSFEVCSNLDFGALSHSTATWLVGWLSSRWDKDTRCLRVCVHVSRLMSSPERKPVFSSFFFTYSAQHAAL